MIEPLRIVMMGTPDFAVPALLALLNADSSRVRVVAVVTQPDRRQGRGQVFSPPPMKAAAEEHQIEVFQPTKLKTPESLEKLRAYRADLFIVAAYGRILPPSWLGMPRLGCLNLHASLLPRFRGASPINRAIWAGDQTTGITLMQMDEGLDTGAMYATDFLTILPEETSAALSRRLSVLGAHLLLRHLPQIAAGTLRARPQPEEGVTFAPLLEKEDGRLNFSDPAAALCRQVRALDPWPGTFTLLGKQRINIKKVCTLEATESYVHSSAAEMGEVLRADKEGVWVQTGDGILCLLVVQPEGRKAMEAHVWALGRHVAVGTKFAR